ncbi:MAG: XRE family transcriptional regulator [Actinomycetota bacterium]|nr:XRE family transcriptional regulator [Actinomycetota bacterium]
MSAEQQLERAGLGSLLGPRLRERRTELGKTLTELARAADLSPGYLSTIENGTSIPSLPVLARLGHALEISLADILRTSSTARIARGNISDGNDSRQLQFEGSGLEIVRHCADAGEHGIAPLPLGNGDVFIYVHSGELEVSADGEIFQLVAGDALHSDRPNEMSWRAVGAGPSIAIWTTAREGTRSPD